MQMICNWKEKLKILSLSLLAVASLVSCQEENDPTAVYVSSYPVYLLVKEVVKEIQPIEILTPNGMEPHDYEISARKVASIHDGCALFLNGLGLESWGEVLPHALQSKTITLSDSITPLALDGILDPHIWLSPLNAIAELGAIKDGLIRLNPEKRAAYETNFGEALKNIEALDKECLDKVSSFANHSICVAHAAFGYLCDRYDLSQIYVKGLTPEAEPTAKELEATIEQIREHNIKVVFVEELAEQDIATKISQETGARLETLPTMEEGDEADDYCSIMREIFEKLEVACK